MCSEAKEFETRYPRFVKCDCKSRCHFTVLWANQYAESRRYFCPECVAFADVEFWHNHSGEPHVVRTGIIKPHHRATVDKDECYFCSRIVDSNSLARRTLEKEGVYGHVYTVEVSSCPKCERTFQSTPKFDDIPF